MRLKIRRWLGDPLDTPGSATFEGWRKWEEKARREHPIWYFLLHTLPTELSVLWRRLVTEPIWWVKYRLLPRHRYHLVPTGDKPGYADQLHRMLGVNMQLLKDYIEEAGGVDELEDWTRQLRNIQYGEAQAEAQAIFARIYRWWTEWRPVREETERELLHWWSECRGNMDDEPSEEAEERIEMLWAFEEAAWEEDQEMLHLLVENRGDLWI